jgi:DNA-binding NarL/FixJ family response regulator
VAALPTIGEVATLRESSTIASSYEHRFGSTLREHNVLEFRCQHCTNKDIAEALSVSPRTVQSQTISVFTRFGGDYRRDATTLAVRHGPACPTAPLPLTRGI